MMSARISLPAGSCRIVGSPQAGYAFEGDEAFRVASGFATTGGAPNCLP